MKKILVTGATGFIGARIVRQLCERGDDIKVLVRPGSSTRLLKNLPIEISYGDITLGDSVYRALAGCNRLLHVAAAYKMWSATPKEILEPAVRGTREVLEAVRRREGSIEKVVVTSSSGTLGVRKTPESMNEQSSFNISDPEIYVKAKYESEQIALEAARDVPVVIVNPSAVFGPGDWRPTPSGFFVLRFLNWNHWFKFPTSLGGISIVDVDDVARGHLLALDKGQIGQRYILGGENVTFIQAIEMMASITGFAGPAKPFPKSVVSLFGYLQELIARWKDTEPELTHRLVRDYFDGFVWVSSNKAIQELGYNYRPARKTLARAIRFYLDQNFVQPALAASIRYDELPGPDPMPMLLHERNATFAEG